MLVLTGAQTGAVAITEVDEDLARELQHVEVRDWRSGSASGDPLVPGGEVDTRSAKYASALTTSRTSYKYAAPLGGAAVAEVATTPEAEVFDDVEPKARPSA